MLKSFTFVALSFVALAGVGCASADPSPEDTGKTNQALGGPTVHTQCSVGRVSLDAWVAAPDDPWFDGRGKLDGFAPDFPTTHCYDVSLLGSFGEKPVLSVCTQNGFSSTAPWLLTTNSDLEGVSVKLVVDHGASCVTEPFFF